jgi:RNA polymerase sigma-70 factor, ECF subfamily
VPNQLERRFLSLVHENDARLRRICRVYAHDSAAREDLHQEILLQLWRSLPNFAGASSINTWLYRVALNTALSFARRAPARREIPLDDDRLDPEDTSSPNAGDQLDRGSRIEQMEEAIAHLGDVDRMLMTMYLDDRSYREIADVLGISESNVGVKLHRLRKLLAARLAKEEEPV